MGDLTTNTHTLTRFIQRVFTKVALSKRAPVPLLQVWFTSELDVCVFVFVFVYVCLCLFVYVCL